ncbi:hypothetical protein [Bacteroides pyogenes]|uniref:hypothetical protein n=1 Tax=Bacteroides pyogenes TaxID=310300 RepID=UPI002A832FCE|nr:hypothetical protein [Bacteroides pyogenes]MDY4248682.1 hypothetical protein [Bacteroides pyogenes]
MGTKILVEEIAENTWFTGGLRMNYFLIHVHEYDGDYFKDLADLLLHLLRNNKSF